MELQYEFPKTEELPHRILLESVSGEVAHMMAKMMWHQYKSG
jgi:hypothetical protein